MCDSIILIGGSGHAKVIIDCISASGRCVAGILDDGIPIGTAVHGVPVLGKSSDYEVYRNYSFLVAIGNNTVRRRIADSMNVVWATIIHPSAVVSTSAIIGHGTVVMPHAVINADSVVGNHCIINSGAIVEHDNRLADFVHISPRAALGGAVSVGKETHIGIGASVRNNIHISSNCVVGAGAAVVKHIEVPGIYVGVPAKQIK